MTFSTEDTTPHGESITLKCDTQNGYYENTYAKTEYTITCKDGSWQGVSMCVRKCKFTKSEFSKEYIVKGRNVSSQSTENQYEIIAGERRWRAAQLANLNEVPVLIKDANDQAAASMALIENMQREDLNALEEANGLARLIEEFGYTHDKAAQAVGKSRSAVSNLLRLIQLWFGI